jgi:hypothetical protein
LEMLPRQKQKNEEAEEPQRHQPQALLRPPVVQLFGEPGVVNLPNNVNLRHGASSFDSDLLAARWSRALKNSNSKPLVLFQMPGSGTHTLLPAVSINAGLAGWFSVSSSWTKICRSWGAANPTEKPEV